MTQGFVLNRERSLGNIMPLSLERHGREEKVLPPVGEEDVLDMGEIK